MQLRKIFFGLMISGPSLVWAQAESAKVNGYLGTTLLPSSKQELLGGFSAGLTVGVGISKTMLEKFVLNPNIEFTASSKEHFSFSLLSLHLNLKYYPISLSKVRPYLMAIGNLSFMNLHQQAYATAQTPDAIYYGTDPSNIVVSQVVYREPDLKLQFAPTVGIGAGLGMDFTFKLKWVPFVQYSFVNYFSKSSGLLNNNFKNNTANLSTQNIVLGLRYNLYQSLSK